MKILKTLNNNVIVSVKDDEEVIVMGRGIAFNKKAGDDINENQVDKIFTLEDENITTKLKR
ncbi:CAT RNA binding domain-containing protein [Salipaludibacillus sp. CF4.18]|uniref:CAT RNA binding domain-containing protein n=1 Tax=Salipaludibacillus sp. CF4.18 TaxID=3373081 RepID=UPI003EE50BA9